jgi:hypothetical protein
MKRAVEPATANATKKAARFLKYFLRDTELLIMCPTTTPMNRKPVKACNPMVVIENGWIKASIPDTAITPKRRALKSEMIRRLFKIP